MGGRSSKTPPTCLDRPWRDISWGDRQRALEYVNNYRPQTEGQQIRILLHGPVGAGKSSFINSVQSILRGRMCNLAKAATSQYSVTKKYTTYKIPKRNNGENIYPFVINDMMGLQNNSRRNRRIHVKDVKQLLKGHVRDGYTFNPECKISKEDRYYNKHPTASDKVHILVFVIDANKFSLMRNEILETILDIIDEASDLDIPQVAIFTKIDELCPEIKEDVKNVYKSIKLQKMLEQFSADVGIEMNSIFAVKNYTNTNFDNDTDALILNALRHIIDYGDDSLNKMLNDD